MTPEDTRSFAIYAGNMLEVLEDHAKCSAQVEANRLMVSLIRGHQMAVEA